MKIIAEKNLRDFDFWAGAKDTVKYLTDEELDIIEFLLEDIYPNGLDEVSLNDFFWFDDESIAELLGFENFDEIIERGICHD